MAVDVVYRRREFMYIAYIRRRLNLSKLRSSVRVRCIYRICSADDGVIATRKCLRESTVTFFFSCKLCIQPFLQLLQSVLFFRWVAIGPDGKGGGGNGTGKSLERTNEIIKKTEDLYYENPGANCSRRILTFGERQTEMRRGIYKFGDNQRIAGLYPASIHR